MRNDNHQKGQPEHYQHKDYTVDAIWINIECYAHLIDNHLEYLPKDISAGVITNDQVIDETLELIKRVGDLVHDDLSNIKRCVAFVKKRYPHATFSSYIDVVGIENLSKEQMITCLQQDGLHFDYARVDKNGQVPQEDIVG